VDRGADQLARPVKAAMPSLAVVGGGWAGLAAAVHGVSAGHRVTLFEMAPQLGGRAREVPLGGLPLDNGQHILIGAYTATLALMRQVGVDTDTALQRLPLVLSDARGHGLHLRPGRPAPAFAAAVLRHPSWAWRDKLSLLGAAGRWAVQGFRCDPALDVATLCRGLGAAVRGDLIDPLCVAALNTPAPEASASVFLRVLRDALFSGPGAADLLLPRCSLGALLPEPAGRWLGQAGASLRLAQRVQGLAPHGGGWRVDGEAFDRVVLATPPREAARLSAPIDAAWAETARAMRYEPIVTVYLRCDGARLPFPMVALQEGPDAPAQFVFDRGRLGGPAGLLAFVVSGAQAWVERGADATLAATQAQARRELGACLAGPLEVVKLIVEKRATFRCTPALQRPALRIAPGLHAAGDHVEGPYPATLEGAVRSAALAVHAFG